MAQNESEGKGKRSNLGEWKADKKELVMFWIKQQHPHENSICVVAKVLHVKEFKSLLARKIVHAWQN